MDFMKNLLHFMNNNYLTKSSGTLNSTRIKFIEYKKNRRMRNVIFELKIGSIRSKS